MTRLQFGIVAVAHTGLHGGLRSEILLSTAYLPFQGPGRQCLSKTACDVRLQFLKMESSSGFDSGLRTPGTRHPRLLDTRPTRAWAPACQEKHEWTFTTFFDE